MLNAFVFQQVFLGCCQNRTVRVIGIAFFYDQFTQSFPVRHRICFGDAWVGVTAFENLLRQIGVKWLFVCCCVSPHTESFDASCYECPLGLISRAQCTCVVSQVLVDELRWHPIENRFVKFRFEHQRVDVESFGCVCDNGFDFGGLIRLKMSSSFGNSY
ncbi:hypothetical protein D3C73_1328310 [compost metagenome]